MKKMIFLSYDLDFNSDYDSLFCWLDNHDANECGKGVACLYYNADDALDVDQYLGKLKEDISKNVALTPKDRIYVIINGKNKNGVPTLRGSFIFGKRMGNPWYGYGNKMQDEDEEMFNV